MDVTHALRPLSIVRGGRAERPRPAIAALGTLGLVLVGAGILAPLPAGAAFTGATNGHVAFAAICDSNIGQPVYSLDPNGSPPPTYNCPPGGAAPYTQTTAGSTDAMPYFSADGQTIYFSSDRLATATTQGANGDYALYEAPYPPTVSGAPGSQTDGATQITFPGSTSNDYAPTVSADGAKMAFIRCNGGTTSCALYVQSPIIGGTPTLVSTSVALSQPNSVSGEASRPEIDPTDPNQVIYEGVDGHLHLVSLASPAAFAERDLSSESGISSGQTDEYPDWNAAACQLWGASDPGTEIEPLFAPTDTAVSSPGNCNPSGDIYVWTRLGGGSNIILDMGHSVSSPVMLDALTKNKTNNSQTAWQPVPLGTGTPEVPLAVLLPLAGAAFMGGALLLELRRRRAQLAHTR